jgi:hypothetical protein
MSWDIDTKFANVPQVAAGRDASIELVGTHLRMLGTIPLGRFGRLTDLINASSGYIEIHDARLLRRNGDPTTLVLPEIMVDQDEISFIAQTDPEQQEQGSSSAAREGPFGRPENRTAREFVMFTPGHTITGTIYVFGQTDLRGFVDTTDPRFLPVTGATTRSLADRRIISHYPFLVLNRTHMIAASEIGHAEAAGVDEPVAEA